MRAIVKTSFDGRPDDEALSRTIAVGETITGDLAAVAAREGWADEEVLAPAKEEQPPSNAQAELEAQTVDELKALAKERGVDLGEATRKADIVAALVAAPTAPSV